MNSDPHPNFNGKSITLHRAVVITPHEIAYGNGARAVPHPGLAGDVACILDGTLGRFEPHSTIVIDGLLPAAVAAQTTAITAGGWRWGEIGAWTVFHRPDRTVSVGLRDAMTSVHLGVLFDRATDPGVLAVLLDTFSRVTGGPWRGTSATSALNTIRSTWGNPRHEPLWKLPHIGARRYAGPLMWSRKLAEGEREWGWVHTFDRTAAYLAEAINGEFAWSRLHQVGPQPFDPAVPGYWTLELSNSTMQSLRDSSRPPLLRSGSTRAEVTTPMAKLLLEEGDRLDVVDSWTARAEMRKDGSRRLHPAGARVLRPWAEGLRDGLAGQMLAPVRGAAKECYRAAVGAMQREGMRIHRPDWGHTIMDGNRAHMLRTARRMKASEGIWPVRIATDSISYCSSTPDPSSLERALGCRPGVGKFRHVATYSVAEWDAKYAGKR